MDAFWSGDWDTSVDLAEEGLALCIERGYTLPAWAFRLAEGLVSAARGDESRATELADLALQWATPRAIHGVRAFGEHVRAAAALSNAEWDTAVVHLSRISAPGNLPRLVAYAIWTHLDLVEALVRSRRASEARAHIAAIGEAGLESISPRQLFLSRCCLLWVASDEDAGRAYEEMLASSEGGRWPFELARTELGFGERLRRSRATTEARTHLERSLEVFRWLGAKPWAERAAAELRATGLGVARIDGFEFAELTAREREIAELAAAGYANKQIGERLHLSPRTVSAHLYRIYPKLGVASRAGLRDALGRMSSESS